MLTPEEINNRTKWHPPKNENTINKHADIRTVINTSINVVNKLVPKSREKDLAITKLEEAMMWANAGIARNQDA
jgi:hypothetical protein